MTPESPFPDKRLWELYDLATQASNKSRCDRSKVGVALAHPDGAVFVAYNAVEPGHNLQTCKDFCQRGRQSYIELPQDAPFTGPGRCTAIHAEMVAIQAAKESLMQTVLRLSGAAGVAVEEDSWPALFTGFWMISTRRPCDDCRREIDKLGIIPIWSQKGKT